LSIRTQLRLGLGAILALVVALGVIAWFQVGVLWQQTDGMYRHPLAVRRAIAEVHSGIQAMHQGMEDLFLVEDDRSRQEIVGAIDTQEARIIRQIAVLRDRYLGPIGDVSAIQDALVQWKSVRDETIRLLRAGKTAEAGARQKSTGIDGARTTTLMDCIRRVDGSATVGVHQFYQNAQREKDGLVAKFATIFGSVLLLSALVSYLLLKRIRTPLQDLASAAERYRRGDLNARSQYASTNEFGVLAASFNALADTIQAEFENNKSTARIADVMLREEEMHGFCRELLKALLDHTGSRIGAVYLLNAAKSHFEHFESIGLAAAGHAPFSAADREGEFGAALATREIQRIKEIPADTRFTFSNVIGDFTPREIMTIPLFSGQDAVAVVSLASVRNYSEPAVRLLHDLRSVLTARLNGVLALRQLQVLAERLEHQNRELEAQKRALVAQAGELTEQNSELELQKKQLNEASRLKSVFLSNMSHELRTPLNSVIALSGVLSRRLADSIPREELGYLEVIERNGKNLLELINDILDLSRIEAGREEISLGRFSVRELAAEVVAMIEPQTREKNIAILNTVSPDLPSICSDFSKCRHILQNLVGNAVKFTQEGTVEVSAVQVDDTVRIAVSDTGIGIAPGQIQYIFDEFRQADESTTKTYGGTGLGLSIARKYATLLGGSIDVVSTPGQGATFTLRLPLTPAEATTSGSVEAPRPLVSKEAPSTPRGECDRILLVEDSEPVVVQMTDILAETGYRVEVAHNGKEALEHIEKLLPDAMILDLMMPEVDGFEVLHKLRSEERTKHIPVLILTAKYVTPEELTFLKGNRIHQLIQKGAIDRVALLAAVGSMVPRRGDRPAPPARKPVRTRASGKPIVLVVEDNPDNMTTTKVLLQDICTVIEAADGQSGIERARRQALDLVLMDISLPGLDGYEALDAIRKEEALRHVPVIAVTAHAMKGSREEILARGFDGYISKPIDRETFERTVKEALYGGE
jgi:signal transduction histidine kinase/CheY-like chemotaxis protein/HAMP domain-containing protein